MAHFAQLDENNLVMQVIVVSNQELLDEAGKESEAKGVQFCKFLFGENTNWKQTSYNGNFRKHYARAGFTYDLALDAFVPPSPYKSWTLNTDTIQWEPPIPYPEGGKFVFVWDEDSLSWVETEFPVRNGEEP